jgi:hypothetical protein
MRRSFFTFCLGALIAFVASGVRAQDTDFIIESRSDGLNNQFYQEISGKWMDSNIPPELAKSSAPGASKCGTRKSAFSGPNITVIGPSAARFSLPTLQRASHLYVYATWPRGANAMPVNFRIRHAAGLNVRQIAQDGWGVLPAGCNAGQWILLGDYDFSGANQYVEVATENDATALEPRW